MWKETEELDFKSVEEIKISQEASLQKQIEYLYCNSPFYKRLFDRNKITFKSIKGISDLLRLPRTTKEDLERDNKSFLCVQKKKIVDHWEVWKFVCLEVWKFGRNFWSDSEACRQQNLPF